MRRNEIDFLVLLCISAIECHALLAPYNGVIVGDSNQSYSVESTIEFSCSDGYLMTGSSTLICQEDGSWSGSVPLCEGKAVLNKVIITLSA